MKRLGIFFTLISALVLGATTVSAQTLKAVNERGVRQGLIGFSSSDDKGNWSGFDVDFCRALSAAIFNDPSKVKFVPLSADERFPALKSGSIDVLSRNTTWTMSRETLLGVTFSAITYYDGQGFLVRKALKIDTALELDGKSVCTQTGTTSMLNLADYFRSNKMKYDVVAAPNSDAMLKAYDADQCKVLTSDISQLHAEKLKLARADDHIILPEIISKEPLGPAVRQGDDQWSNIVKWTHYAMVNAEELGVNSRTVDQALKSEKPDVMRLVGIDGNYGEQLGLTKDWIVRIVSNVGNYGEVFEKNVGTGSRLGIPRGINNLWSTGGLQYAPPIR